MRHLALLLFAQALLGLSSHAADLDSLLRRPDLWALDQAQFEAAREAAPFSWTSATRDSARAGERGLTLYQLPVVEALARFDGGKLKELTANLFARGDAGDLSRERFESMLRTSMGVLDRSTGVKMTQRGKDATNAVRADGFVWETPQARYLLEYSFTSEVKSRSIPFRAEFIRLEITPPHKSVSLLTSATNMARTRFSGKMHVKRDLATGDVHITSVPMVDQGAKGYCAVACLERVMRYYGLQIDANELAQVANSDADLGTSPDVMFQALKKLGAQLRLRVRPLEQLEVKNILELVRDYNRAAQRQGRAQPINAGGLILDVGAIYGAMQPELLREVKTRNRADVNRFERNIQSHIDQGVPLLWSVMLGLVPEKAIPQASGGHMRLIIGYNAKTNEVLYSDSWGPGHELKRMSVGDAWTVTTGLTIVEPT